ncbi:TauD/TfdA family dioxygenase [Pseudomonas lalucatii]|nr:TauD/TfdA family dioxygenase [Pseudomonas lalucatii]
MPTTWPIPGCISARIPTTPIAIPCRASSCCTVWSTRPAVACRPWWTASAWSVNWPRRTPRATGCSRTPRSSTASSTAVPSWSATSRSSRPTPRAAPWACITAPPRWPAAAAARAAESLPPRPPASGRTVLRPGLPDPLPLLAGELMLFDNSRVLHGRTRFDPSEGPRHLQGCYIDLDGPRERYASVRIQLSTLKEVA